MRNLLNFLLKYNDRFLFLLLEVFCLFLLFRFNSYQGSVFFTSANRITGYVYEVADEVTGYFHLKTMNDGLVQRNVELELQAEYFRHRLAELTADGTIDKIVKKYIPAE